VRPPSASTFASLCSRASRAVSSPHTTAARTPAWRLAAIETPIPVPQITMPRARFPAPTASATWCA
jgi:hypothetical protein